MPNEKPLALQLFEAQKAFEQTESEVYTALCRVLNVDLANGDPPCFVKWTFDDYDSSFDLLGVLPSVAVSSEQLQSFWNLGFAACLFHYQGGKEVLYRVGSETAEVYE
jgi:hypothetical protein